MILSTASTIIRPQTLFAPRATARWRFDSTIPLGRAKRVSEDNEYYIRKRGPGEHSLTRKGASRATALFRTEEAAIKRAKELSPGRKPHIEREVKAVKGKPPQFRTGK
jgi:hypothetical protein